MKYRWSEAKNKKLIKERGVSFEMCVAAMREGNIVAIEKNSKKYSHQKVFAVKMNSYVHLVPFIEVVHLSRGTYYETKNYRYNEALEN